MTLNAELEVTQGNSSLYHSKDSVQFLICLI